MRKKPGKFTILAVIAGVIALIGAGLGVSNMLNADKDGWREAAQAASDTVYKEMFDGSEYHADISKRQVEEHDDGTVTITFPIHVENEYTQQGGADYTASCTVEKTDKGVTVKDATVSDPSSSSVVRWPDDFQADDKTDEATDDGASADTGADAE